MCPMNESPSKKRFGQFDYLRGLAIIGIVLGHVTGRLDILGQGNDDIALTNIGIFDMRLFCIPLFFLVSGTIFFINYNERFDLKRYYTKRVKRMVPPYLLFSAAYIAAHYLLYNPLTLNEMLFMVATFYAHPHFWFILAILQFYLIFPLLLPIAKKQRGMKIELLMLCALLIFQSLMNASSFPLRPTTVLTQSQDSTIWAFSRLLFFMQYIFWFYLGMIIGKHLNRFEGLLVRQQIPILICLPVAIIAAAIMPIYYPLQDSFFVSIIFSAIMLVEIFGIYRFSLILTNRQKVEQVKFLGRESFGIYMIHPMVILGIVPLLGIIGLTNLDPIFYPILLIATIAVSIVFVLVIRRIPNNRILLG